jgi:hypothetical protein
MSFADRPLALCGLLRMVQAVLREIPSARACSSSVQKPDAVKAFAISRMLVDCRTFFAASDWYGLLTSGHNQMKRALLFSLNCPTAATIIYNSPLPPASETDIHHDQSW